MRLAFLFVIALLSSPQIARSAANARQIVLSGTIVSAKGDALVIDTGSGRETVSYNSKLRFFAVSRSSIDDVTAGSFIGTTVVPQPDGTFTSTEVHIFAPSLRGTGEGFTKMDGPGRHMMANSAVRTVVRSRMMANSTVRTVGATATGKTITMVFPSGTKTIRIPSNVAVVYLEPATSAMLTPGTHVRIAAVQNGKTITARFVLVGRHGLVPPM